MINQLMIVKVKILNSDRKITRGFRDQYKYMNFSKSISDAPLLPIGFGFCENGCDQFIYTVRYCWYNVVTEKYHTYLSADNIPVNSSEEGIVGIFEKMGWDKYYLNWKG